MEQLSSVQLIWAIAVIVLGCGSLISIVLFVNIVREAVRISKEEKESQGSGEVS